MISNLLEKYNKMSKVTKAAVWFTFATVLQKGIAFFTVPIFARIMTTDQYGLYNTYLSWISVFTVLATMELHTCSYINGLAKMESEHEKNELAISLLDLSFVVTLGWLVLYFLLHDFLVDFLDMPTSMVLLMFVEILFLPAVHFWTVKQRYIYNYKILVLRTILQVLLNAALGILFVVIVQENEQAVARVFAVAVVQVIFGLSMLIWFFRKAKLIFSTKYWRQALRLHLPLVPHRLSLTVLASADRIMIEKMINVSATAVYSVSYSATMVINIIKLSINDALTPWIYDSLKKKNYKSIKKYTVMVMLLVIAMEFVFVLFAPEIVFLVGSRKYMDAIYVMPPVAASVYFTFLYNLFSSVEFYFEKTKQIMMASLVAAITNLVLNYIFIKRYGYVAAGYTTLVCYILLSIAHFEFMRKAVVGEAKVSELFDLKAILGLSILVIASMMVCVMLYSYTILRYFILIISLLMLVLMRKRIINLFKMLKMK